MDNINTDIGIRISKLRKEHGFTQEKLSEELDITSKHISSVERGIASLSLEKMIAASEIFDCTLDYLILGKNTEYVLSILPSSILSILSSDDEKEKKLLLEYINLYSKLRK